LNKLVTISLILLLSLSSISLAQAWSNRGYSADTTNPDYGTHDWIAQHALDWLPTNEKQYILDNLALYLYGTELPDNSQTPDGIGDTTKHHVYYYNSRIFKAVQDDASAVRAEQQYQKALLLLKESNYTEASKIVGSMTHYIADMAVFAHVMGAVSDWGAETSSTHSGYESYVNARTNVYSSEFNSYLAFDGTLANISAYNATLDLAFDSTFDVGGTYNCTVMNELYPTANSTYWDRAGQSLNLAVNTVADVLHSLYLNSVYHVSGTITSQTTQHTTSVVTTTPNPEPTPTQNIQDFSINYVLIAVMSIIVIIIAVSIVLVLLNKKQ
jgi:hypothetical protein